MAKPNKRQRAGTSRDRLVKSARKLASMDPDDVNHIAELRKHFAARDVYVERDKHVNDYVELTPMGIGGRDHADQMRRAGDALLSKQERATRKGRRIERQRRRGERDVSSRWNGGVAERMAAADRMAKAGK
jgi:hypothetical protein